MVLLYVTSCAAFAELTRFEAYLVSVAKAPSLWPKSAHVILHPADLRQMLEKIHCSDDLKNDREARAGIREWLANLAGPIGADDAKNWVDNLPSLSDEDKDASYLHHLPSPQPKAIARPLTIPLFKESPARARLQIVSSIGSSLPSTKLFGDQPDQAELKELTWDVISADGETAIATHTCTLSISKHDCSDLAEIINTYRHLEADLKKDFGDEHEKSQNIRSAGPVTYLFRLLGQDGKNPEMANIQFALDGLFDIVFKHCFQESA
jgi:hypothetical protein